jgi:hypothetical protein
MGALGHDGPLQHTGLRLEEITRAFVEGARNGTELWTDRAREVARQAVEDLLLRAAQGRAEEAWKGRALQDAERFVNNAEAARKRLDDDKTFTTKAREAELDRLGYTPAEVEAATQRLQAHFEKAASLKTWQVGYYHRAWQLGVEREQPRLHSLRRQLGFQQPETVMRLVGERAKQYENEVTVKAELATKKRETKQAIDGLNALLEGRKQPDAVEMLRGMAEAADLAQQSVRLKKAADDTKRPLYERERFKRELTSTTKLLTDALNRLHARFDDLQVNPGERWVGHTGNKVSLTDALGGDARARLEEMCRLAIVGLSDDKLSKF